MTVKAKTKPVKAEMETPPPEELNTSPPEEFVELERAAERILETFPDRMQFVFKEVARERSLALWMLFAGLLQRAYDRGSHTAPVIDPVWARSHPTTRPNFNTTECMYAKCGKSFNPRWPGEQFCSTECGVAHSNSVRTRTVDVERPLVGQETDNDYRSTVNIAP